MTSAPASSAAPDRRFRRRSVAACAVACGAALTVLLLAVNAPHAVPATNVDPWVDLLVSVRDAEGDEVIAYYSTSDVIEVRTEVTVDDADQQAITSVAISGGGDGAAADATAGTASCELAAGDTVAVCRWEHQVTQADLDRGLSSLTTVVQVVDAASAVVRSTTLQTSVVGSTAGLLTVALAPVVGAEDGSDSTEIGFAVTNQGNVSVSAVTATVTLDSAEDTVVTDPICPASDLAPGEQMVCTSQATAATLSDTAVGTVTVAATDPAGRVVGSVDPVPFEVALPAAGATVATGGVRDHTMVLDSPAARVWHWWVLVGVAGLVAVGGGARLSRRGGFRT